jgi:squalene-hopene/tetraprenyl-beta-curcumene cyclase
VVAQSVALRRQSEIVSSLKAATEYLLSKQSPEGYWIGELEADTSLESDYILLQLWLYPPKNDAWNPPTARLIKRAARYILSRQLPDGGWNIYQGGPANVSVSVKAYLALRLAGLDNNTPQLAQAKELILRLGGVGAANSYTKIYLSFFGLYDRAKTPSIPPELFLLSSEAAFSVYEMSSWTRIIIAPLAILGALRSSRSVPEGITLSELSTDVEFPKANQLSLGSLFRLADQALKIWERIGRQKMRRSAIRATSRWIIEHLERSDGLGAIFPAMMNSIMALTELGYSLDDPLLRQQIQKFDKLIIEDGNERDGTMRVQPCLSPVWDTGLAAFAVGRASAICTSHAESALNRAADWLLTKEVRCHGDWSVKNKTGKPGGWYFEFANEFYPDTDDTAQVLLALHYTKSSDPEMQETAKQRGVEWLLSMQSKDGGWGAFDIDSNNRLLSHVPFADHNAMLDPTCPDLTGRVLEALCITGPGHSHQAVRRGVEFLKRTQEEDGSWFGRWGVNYIYGTCFALRGLAAAGEDPREAYIIRAGEWLRSIQNADGGWGETCASYDDSGYKTEGTSTASQTAWALMGLLASGDNQSGSTTAGVQYLLDTQLLDGSWSEQSYTGTGFPGVFYLKYDLYPQYFPLLALTQYITTSEKAGRS